MCTSLLYALFDAQQHIGACLTRLASVMLTACVEGKLAVMASSDISCRQHCGAYVVLLRPDKCMKGILKPINGLQAVMNHSHALSSNAFTVSREEYSRGPNRMSYLSKPRKKGPMRPSMELRHRQLDLSLLQVSLLQPSAMSLVVSLIPICLLGFTFCRNRNGLTALSSRGRRGRC